MVSINKYGTQQRSGINTISNNSSTTNLRKIEKNREKNLRHMMQPPATGGSQSNSNIMSRHRSGIPNQKQMARGVDKKASYKQFAAGQGANQQ
jgi:hypothetical protein